MVLVVDDDSGVRRLVAHVLAGRGFAPLEARNGLEALELYGSYRSGVALVVTDIDMPVMDGMETISRLRELAPDVRVLVMTGVSRDVTAPGCLLLPKPFTPAQLMDHVERAMA
jgi:two-component system, cell cycle sensor histidine kinase and response regulator CckA